MYTFTVPILMGCPICIWSIQIQSSILDIFAMFTKPEIIEPDTGDEKMTVGRSALSLTHTHTHPHTHTHTHIHSPSFSLPDPSTSCWCLLLQELLNQTLTSPNVCVYTNNIQYIIIHRHIGFQIFFSELCSIFSVV